jgi:hypothetical protein
VNDYEHESRNLSDTLQGALADVIHANDGAVLIKYVTVCEVMETTGERSMWVLATDGMKPWESIGMLEYAHDLERAETNRRDE